MNTAPAACTSPGLTAHPTQAWTTQQARNLATDLGHRTESLRFLLRDRGGKYGQAFDAVFQSDDLRVITTAPQAPRMNAHCEQVIGTLRRELLDHTLILGESHARQVLTTYEDHYNRHRPHQGIANARPLQPLPQPATDQATLTHLDIHRRPRLGGILNEYHHAA